MRRLLPRVALTLGAVSGLLTSGVAAQVQHRVACAFDTAAHIRWDSIDIGLAAGWDRTGKKKLPDDYLAAAQVIQAHFHPPEHVRLPLWARITDKSDTLPDESEWIGHGLDTEVQFWLSDSGRLATERI